MIPSVWLDRFQSFASTTNGNEVKILRLPLLRYDVLDRPLGKFAALLGTGIVAGLSEPLRAVLPLPQRGADGLLSASFHAVHGRRMELLPEVALRDTAYTISQTPQLTGPYMVPQISHSALNRTDLEASIDIRPPALERDYELPFWHRELRHVIEPELNYRYVGGIGAKARDVLLFDTTDIATNVNEAGFSLTQRFYLRPTGERPCATGRRGDWGRRRMPQRRPARRRLASGRAGRLRRSILSTRILAARSFPAGATSSMRHWI